MAPKAKLGKFEVRRLSPPPIKAGKFQVLYLIGSKPVFSQRLEQRPEISDHFFAASTSRKSSAVLELSYGFGAGGHGPVCEYEITRTPTQFVARRPTDPPFTSDRDGDGLPLTAQVVEPPFSPELRKYEGVAHKLTAFPAFTRSYRAIVRPLSQEKWLQLNDPSLGGLNMVTATTRMARYSSGQLIVFSGCKPHFCENADVAVAFNPVTGNTWALVRLEDNTSQWLGPENAEIRKILLSLLSEPPEGTTADADVPVAPPAQPVPPSHDAPTADAGGQIAPPAFAQLDPQWFGM